MCIHWWWIYTIMYPNATHWPWDEPYVYRLAHDHHNKSAEELSVAFMFCWMIVKAQLHGFLLSVTTSNLLALVQCTRLCQISPLMHM